MVGKKRSLESVPGYSRHKEHHKRTKTANVISPGITNEWQHRMQRLHWELKAAEKGKAQLINKEVVEIIQLSLPTNPKVTTTSRNPWEAVKGRQKLISIGSDEEGCSRADKRTNRSAVVTIKLSRIN